MISPLILIRNNSKCNAEAGDEVHLYVVPATNLLPVVSRAKRPLVGDEGIVRTLCPRDNNCGLVCHTRLDSKSASSAKIAPDKKSLACFLRCRLQRRRHCYSRKHSLRFVIFYQLVTMSLYQNSKSSPIFNITSRIRCKEWRSQYYGYQDIIRRRFEEPPYYRHSMKHQLGDWGNCVKRNP